MPTTALTSTAPNTGLRRVLGRYQGRRPGPLLLVLGGIHGNEPAGVRALEKILAALQEEEPPFRGEIVALAGNLGALAARVRYLERDLNRVWTEEEVARLRAGEAGGCPESQEQQQLLQVLEEALGRAQGEVYFLDLHTSSGEGVPFGCIGDTLRNRRFARAFPVPVILGLEEQVDGALLEFLNNRGIVTLGFEGGQHEAPSTVVHHEAAAWLALQAAGLLRTGELPPALRRRISEAVAALRRATAGIPNFLEVRYRHHISEEDGFVMEPGYTHFQPVAAGQLLARDRMGEIRAFYDSRVLLPLYQKKGQDGFFLAREIRPFWLGVSRALRLLRADAVAHWLPGVRRHPRRRDALLVDPRIARWAVVEIFHLLGFRKHRTEEGLLVLSRRRYDLRPPRSWRLMPAP